MKDKIVITFFIIITGMIMVFGTSFLDDDIPKTENVSEEVSEEVSSAKRTEDTITDSTIIFGFIIGLGLIAYFNVIRPKYEKKY